MVNKDLNVELSCLSTVKMMFTKLLLGKEMEDAGIVNKNDSEIMRLLNNLVLIYNF